MNEPRDAFEEELAAFQPLEVSPELRRRIGGRLAGSSWRRSGQAWTIAVVSGLAAAGLAAVLIRRPDSPKVDPDPGSHAMPQQPATSGRDAEPLPTLQAYRLALSRSPEVLDALLDRHAAHTPGAVVPPGRLRALTPVGPGSHDPRGEF